MWPCTESSLAIVIISMEGQLQSVKPYANHKDVLSIESMSPIGKKSSGSTQTESTSSCIVVTQESPV